MVLQMPIIVAATVITGTQFFNLIVFFFWRNKEPYIFLHVALAFTSFFAGLINYEILPFRFRSDSLASFLNKFVHGVDMYINCAAVLLNVLISVDRWLSIERAIWYRTQITRPIVLAAIVGGFAGAFALIVPGQIIYWPLHTILRCTGQRLFTSDQLSFGVWEFLSMPIFLPLLVIFQGRILWIAVSRRLQRFRERRLVAVQGQPRDRVGRIIWTSILASMTVVIVTLISQFPHVVTNTFMRHSVRPNVARVVAYMQTIQHCVSPLIYLAFWPDYRAVLFRLVRYGRMRRNEGRESTGASQGTRSTGAKRRGRSW